MAEITRLFSSSRLDPGEVLRLSEEESHHVHKVLRGRPGDRVEVVDGAGRLFVAELLGRREATILEERPVAGIEGEVVLYQAVPKGRHMDLVVEKATELGVRRVVPLSTERGVVRLSEGDGKVPRWRRVAEAAARQSLRLRIPEVTEAVSLPEAAREAGENGVFLHNGADLPPLEDVVPGSAVGLFVGPEGGFSGGELAVARETGLSLASLGPYRLRSETAGVVAVARACAVLERTRSVGRSR
ncbi:MAG: 16S rRNA (uracil(1498)-N(3))-methyltransferase [uncultured Rubrobacteraceae bacterium]|uniref:Ribosomal RNA small subunit methyltransferase E n=1 Tax=uncultured Rubrobacteraceae bacterium TaxID=349277 RepID=A0A6J4PDV4_9ACTN|nr:MAG: 16S rRNA (uracil(1498)-N(3))-methyltransferase [uncultured Rubrobacteraceae bacterium]